MDERASMHKSTLSKGRGVSEESFSSKMTWEKTPPWRKAGFWGWPSSPVKQVQRKDHFPSFSLQIKQTSSDQYGAVVWMCWMTSCKVKGCRFDSRSGRKTGLQVRSPVGACSREPSVFSLTLMSPSLFFPPFSSL